MIPVISTCMRRAETHRAEGAAQTGREAEAAGTSRAAGAAATLEGLAARVAKRVPFYNRVFCCECQQCLVLM